MNWVYNVGMSMHVEIPDDVAELVAKRAAETGAAPEQVAIRAIRTTLLSDEKLAETLRPIREAFERSEMTEDEAVELFEQEKHAMRRGE